VSVAAALVLIRVPIVDLARNLRAGGDALEPPDLFSPAAMQFSAPASPTIAFSRPMNLRDSALV